MATSLSRRTFLKVGVAGALTLALAGGLYRARKAHEAPAGFELDAAARTALEAIVPVMLKDAISPGSPAVQAAIAGVQDTIAALPLHAQKEIQDLFALLTFGPTRRFMAGLRDDWPNAKQEDVGAFLQSWRRHRIGMLRSAYHALHDLIMSARYADESTWTSIGYPGPIKVLS